ncbi:hypothetical protein Tco_0379939, partial [Tanacetum coccineum]
MPGAPATDDTELGQHMTEFTTRVRQDTDEIYGRLISTTCRDWSFADSRPHLTGTTYGDTKTGEYTTDTGDSTAG